MSENTVIAGIVKEIMDLKPLALVELVEELKEKLGISESMLAVPAAGAAGGGEAAAPVEEKTSFDVEMAKYEGAKKVDAIKVVRSVTSLGLKEAKELVETGGKVKEGATKEEAEKIQKELKALGATVSLT